ncbi:MAG TPA: two-component system activity regulator YycH [Pseudogracilibacillus sp.]|nr:two-component system activity regulator YycH [Pseudogracilibacillus sp.]
MTYETVKSYILVILIGLSILLSVALWTYQPNYEQFQNPDYVNEVDIGGEVKEKKDLINPSSIIFHDQQRLLGFENLKDQIELHQSINEWIMYDLEESESRGKPNQEKFVEILYPNPLPIGVASSLFTFNNDIELPDWEFDRIYLSFNVQKSSLEIQIISVDKERELSATIDKRENYDMLFDYAVNHTGLIDYISFDTKNGQIYIPSRDRKLNSKTLVISKIAPEKLVNALFRNPSRVTPNNAEGYFTDGQRGMSVLNNNKIEFINPIQTNSEEISAINALDQSIIHINEHKGWTNDYILERIISTQSKVRFRLMYKGFPVFDQNNLALIEQRWRNIELYEYNRPLIRLTHEIDSTQTKLPSGQKVINYIQNKSLFNLDDISQMQVGYKLSFLSGTSDNVVLLEPNWYVKNKNQWEFVDLSELTDKGGE